MDNKEVEKVEEQYEMVMLKDVEQMKSFCGITPMYHTDKKPRGLIAYYLREKSPKEEDATKNHFMCIHWENSTKTQIPQKKVDRKKMVEHIIEEMENKKKTFVSLYLYWDFEDIPEDMEFYYDPEKEYDYIEQWLQKCVEGTGLVLWLLAQHQEQYSKEGILQTPHFHVLLEYEKKPKNNEDYIQGVAQLMRNMYRTWTAKQPMELYIRED